MGKLSGGTRVVWGLASLLVVGCGTGEKTLPPSINIVQSANHVTTGQKGLNLYDLSPLWQSHNHTDLSATDCYDMEISPDGKSRFLAFARENEKDGYELVVLRDSGGTDDWDDYSAVEIAGPSIPFYQFDEYPERCIRPRVEHLHGEPLEVACNTSVTKVLIDAEGCHLADYNALTHLPAHLIAR